MESARARVPVLAGAPRLCDWHEPGPSAGLTPRGQSRNSTAPLNLSWTIEPSGSPDVLSVEGDIAVPATADRIIGGALERFGRVDTLINNAGVFFSKPVTDYTADDYALMVGVNLTGFFWLTQRAIAEMLKRGGGHVVNVSATVADNANSGEPAVLPALTKGGLASATRSLAIEYASRGIRVNAVSPANIKSPMHAPETYEGLARMIPLGRVGQVSDVVNGILFLESSPYITGEIVHIDGGQAASRRGPG